MQTREAIALFYEELDYRGIADTTRHTYEWAFSRLLAEQATLPGEREIKRLIANAKTIETDETIQPRPLGKASKWDLWRNYKALYRWLASEKLVTDEHGNSILASLKPPCTKKELRRRFPRTWSDQELQAIFRAASRRDKAMSYVALDAGPRLEELTNISRPDIHRESITVHGKAGDRTIYLSPTARQSLIGIGDARNLWISQYHKPLSKQGVRTAFKRLLARAGIDGPKAGPHTFRHTFGLRYILNGGDVFSLQRLMGHEDVSMTMVYVEMADHHLAAQHAKYSPLANLSFLQDYQEEERAQ